MMVVSMIMINTIDAEEGKGGGEEVTIIIQYHRVSYSIILT
jgi:hypothetical protein